MRRPDGPTIFLGTSITVAACLAVYFSFFYERSRAVADPGSTTELALAEIPFDGRQAYEYLKQICQIGRRPSGSPGMQRQQQLLIEHFGKLGVPVRKQEFQVRHPEDGTPVAMTNLIVEWHPDRMDRILLCAHYDTRPYPDNDRRRPRGTFVGANDGGSGVALLMELGRHLTDFKSPLGVDFVLFDGEEFVFDEKRDREKFFIGSTFFARDYAGSPPPYRYRAGVLLDMVADANLELYQEKNSLWHARPVVTSIWDTAGRLGVKEFIKRSRHELRDDHIPLNEIAKIPTCDIIDFDYPRAGRTSYWHTEADTPDKCSPSSLAKVGWVLLEWMRTAETTLNGIQN
jgi:glutaminyl-peptide cyclotransferase